MIRVTGVVDTAADLIKADPSVYETVYVRGRITPSDGGGGLYAWNTSGNPAAANGGTTFPSSKTSGTWGTWEFDHAQIGPALPAAIFGFSQNQDCTKQLQRAIEYCARPNQRKLDLQLPMGRFGLTQVVNKLGVNIRGAAGGFVTRNGGVTGVSLFQMPGSVGSMIRVLGKSAVVEGIEMVGAKPSADSFKIFGVASRTVFHAEIFPIPELDGISSYCQFFSPDNVHLGFGLVQKIEAGIVTLVPGSDLYATPAGQLVPGMRVAFTPMVSTTWVEGTVINKLSPSSIGNAVIEFGHTNDAIGLAEPHVLRNCGIRNGHTGLLLTTSVQPHVEWNTFGNCLFSAIAPMHANNGGDGMFSNNIIQGNYVPVDYPNADPCAAYQDQHLRKTRFGVWGSRTCDKWMGNTIEDCIDGIEINANDVSLSDTTFDRCLRTALVHAGGMRLKTNMTTVRVGMALPGSAFVRATGLGVTAQHGMRSFDGTYEQEFSNESQTTGVISH